MLFNFSNSLNFMLWAMGTGVVTAVFILAIIKITKKRPKETKKDLIFDISSTDQSEDQRNIRASWLVVKGIDQTVYNIKNSIIRAKMTDIRDLLGKIFYYLAQNSDKVTDTKELFNYFLPRLSNFLQTYSTMERSGANNIPEDILIKFLDDYKDAMQKILNNFYQDSALDMSFEMKNMTQTLKNQGLIENDDFK